MIGAVYCGDGLFLMTGHFVGHAATWRDNLKM